MLSDMLRSGAFQYRIATKGGMTAIAATMTHAERDVSCASSPTLHTAISHTAAAIVFLRSSFIVEQ
jgi:hypothetical protein